MIVDEPNGFYPEVSKIDFEWHLAYIAKNYKIISLDEVVERIKNRNSLRGRVVITFDDGFQDNYKNAYPLLKKYNVPATIFLTSGFIEERIIPWFIKLRHIFMKTQKTHFQFPLNDKNQSFSMRTKQEKLGASDKMMAYLKDCPDEKRMLLIDSLCEQLGVIEFQEFSNLMLTWEQIREMSEDGIFFGAHTVTHPVLTRISLDTVEKEIRQSKEAIEVRTGKPVTSFAYPFGKIAHYSAEFFPILRKFKFSCAVTTEIGTNSHKTNLFELSRPAWEQFFMGE